MSEFDTDYTREITCPYCGYVFSDSWEYGPGDLEWDEDIDCGRCEKTFHASKTVSIDYSTRKMEAA